MHSHHLEPQLDRPGTTYSSYAHGTLLDRLQQPSVLVPLLLIILTIFYQSLHSSSVLSRPRHPGELLWDFIIAVTPAAFLYAVDGWLRPPIFPTPESMLSTRSRSYVTKSDLLRRILGMDGPGGIITSVADAGRRSLSSLSNGTLVKQNSDQPPGLGNYDNSCFQNSILQGLSSLQPFPSYLARGLEQDKPDSDDDSGSASSLRDLISKLTDPSYNGKTLWTPKKLKSLDTWQQQDAQEYFSKILDEVEKEIIKAARPQQRPIGFEMVSVRDDTEDSQHSDDSGYQSLPVPSKAGSEARIVRNPLEGLVAQRVACVQCGHSDGLSMIPFNCLTLNLGLEQTEHDLFERLDSYTDLETIEGVECAKCTLLKLQRLLSIIIARGRGESADEAELREPISRLEAVELALEEDDFREVTLRDRCKVQKRASSTKTKQVAIARPPQSLAIHMNRSVFDETTGLMFKNFAAVRFPKTLDLGPWCLGSAGRPVSPADNNTNSSACTQDEEQWIIDPRSSMVSGDLKPSRISGPIYELRAVITHQGRHENGHYVCYRRHPCQPSKPIHSPFQTSESPDDGDDESTLVDGVDSSATNRDLDAKWWRLSDESVWEVSEETVLAQGGVFMLFYDCVDPNSVLVSTLRQEVKAYNENLTLPAGQHIGDGIETDSVEEQLDGELENDGQLHSTTYKELQEQTQSDVITSDVSGQTSKQNPVINNGQLQETEQPSWSSLIPYLADGERVDFAIPLHRPNC
ncbi:cysteine proteinase [Hypomontagnella submonticulosa]|nr:cysteine proteinase [Hypomontagnella submonticulosa]